MKLLAVFLVFGILNAVSAESYLPKVVYGTPVSMEVTLKEPEIDPIRLLEVYRIDFIVESDLGTPDNAIVHRSYEEFEILNQMIDDGQYLARSAQLPSSDDADVETLNDYLQQLTTDQTLMESTLMSDFLAANWDGKDLNFMNSLEDFLYMLLRARVPDFMPQPPVIEQDAYLAEEAPFEVYVYLQAFRHDKRKTEEFLNFFNRYCESTPAWQNPNGDELDETDVAHPETPGGIVEYPYHYNLTYVHFLPGGYLNGHTVRVSYLGKSKFSFLDEDRLAQWITDLHGDKSPKRILDVGAGACFSSFVYGEIFPEAEVIGVELSPAYVRFCRAWAEDREGGPPDNVQFYQANGEYLPMFEDESFDLINYAYVLHEMPAYNAKQMVNEMYRMLTPGGTMNGFEVPYVESDVAKVFYTVFNTWGHDWSVQGKQGPEPYIHEYEFDFRLPEYLEMSGWENVEVIDYSFFESIFLANKPLAATTEAASTEAPSTLSTTEETTTGEEATEETTSSASSINSIFLLSFSTVLFMMNIG